MLKKLSLWKKIAIVFLMIFIVAVGGALTYRLIKTQGVREDYKVNFNADFPRLVIATQKSKFKDEVLRQAIEELKKQDIEVFVTDVTRLSELSDSDWDGMIILTTVESGQIQEDSHDFLKNHKNDYNRIGLIYTADSNTWKNKDIEIDAIASASIKKNIVPCVQAIVDKSNAVLENLQ
ncbi:MAG: hypothetical protein JW924_09910 [Fusobacteriaceae bacterium]|nr:hypothetical protein [Fusobacteriaceae bacterium]